jgi:hypothetical protein
LGRAPDYFPQVNLIASEFVREICRRQSSRLRVKIPCAFLRLFAAEMNLESGSRGRSPHHFPLPPRQAGCLSHISIYWLICTTVAGGKPLKYVEDAWL